MSFTATGSIDTDGAVIAGDGFFPEISPTACRKSMRIDGTVTPQRLRDALIEAIASVQAELSSWVAEQIANGHATLDNVPALQVDGKSILTHRYIRAVFCLAAANCAERYKGFDATGAGQQKADSTVPTIDDLLRDASWAMSDMQGRRRTVVELI
ncbi:head completion/stabilization protein [Methylobacillus glycogenes]|uniref:head completion/stabilization protein n=1 Tax=Methylobacillus glycogenes TaxID=406 RepID=UPI000472082A|nr:head completion/stabilization protein [Methylobacillus glycogenes]